MLKVLYFTFIENPIKPENVGVMNGQVVELLKMLKDQQKDIHVKWVGAVSGATQKADAFHLEEFEKKLQSEGLDIDLIPMSNDSVWQRYEEGRQILYNAIDFYKPKVVHCRLYPATLIAVQLRNQVDAAYKILFDPRGLYPEQILQRNNPIIGRLRYFWWKSIEKMLLRNVDKTICVSDSFVSYYKSIYKPVNTETIHCCYNSDKIYSEAANLAIKRSLDFSEDSLIAVYSGNLTAKYSSLKSLVNLIKSIESTDNRFRFLILSKSPTVDLKKLLNKHSLIDKVKIKSLNPEDVSKYLQLADVALLYRDKSTINEVAMPTKFSEYLAAGLPVIASSYTTAVAEIIKKEKIGIVLDKPSIEKSQLEDVLAISKEQCLEAATLFSTEKAAQRYAKLYKQLRKET